MNDLKEKSQRNEWASRELGRIMESNAKWKEHCDELQTRLRSEGKTRLRREHELQLKIAESEQQVTALLHAQVCQLQLHFLQQWNMAIYSHSKMINAERPADGVDSGKDKTRDSTSAIGRCNPATVELGSDAGNTASRHLKRVTVSQSKPVDAAERAAQNACTDGMCMSCR